MNRPWVIWSILLSCVILILGMLGWMTHRTLGSEQERVNAQAEADYFERIRLALSRMDAIGLNLLVVENQRPVLHYQSLISSSQGLQPSPLLTEEGGFVRLHFEFDGNGEFSSPQVPDEAQQELLLRLNALSIKKRNNAWNDLCTLEEMPTLKATGSLNFKTNPVEKSAASNDREQSAWISGNRFDVAQNKLKAKKVYNEKLTKREEGSRERQLQKAIAQATQRSAQVNLTLDEFAPQESQQISKISPFRASWIQGSLFLIREVPGEGVKKYQGVWLDHEKLKKEFEQELSLDLAGVKVKSLLQSKNQPFALVSLPWQLVPEALSSVQLPLLTPMRKTMLLAWLGALCAIVALFFLLRGVMTLSERRAAFVSSVTHELRTPLTTFRLYSEMLADGMVADKTTRQEYLRTMQGESERLNHLVENVLSYSQIERGTARSKFEKLQVEDLVERLRPVLQRRVDQEDATLSIEIEKSAGEVETDVTAVEQILFNLIDNACKYGLPENGQGHITLHACRDRRGLFFEVSDEGKGIQSHERKRLFRAFHKSAREAAHSKPGVGLGLALCRRLAKALGGELTLAKKTGRGAKFCLQLP